MQAGVNPPSSALMAALVSGQRFWTNPTLLTNPCRRLTRYRSARPPAGPARNRAAWTRAKRRAGCALVFDSNAVLRNHQIIIFHKRLRVRWNSTQQFVVTPARMTVLMPRPQHQLNAVSTNALKRCLVTTGSIQLRRRMPIDRLRAPGAGQTDLDFICAKASPLGEIGRRGGHERPSVTQSPEAIRQTDAAIDRAILGADMDHRDPGRARGREQRFDAGHRRLDHLDRVAGASCRAPRLSQKSFWTSISTSAAWRGSMRASRLDRKSAAFRPAASAVVAAIGAPRRRDGCGLRRRGRRSQYDSRASPTWC